jgi:hypothetical protein
MTPKIKMYRRNSPLPRYKSHVSVNVLSLIKIMSGTIYNSAGKKP